MLIGVFIIIYTSEKHIRLIWNYAAFPSLFSWWRNTKTTLQGLDVIFQSFVGQFEIE